VRHLVLPGAIENSYRALEELAKIDNKIHIALMNQYTPLYGGKNLPELSRPVTTEEFNLVYDHLLELGFTNGWAQDESSQGVLVPDFNKSSPFVSGHV
jgi:putative pyruvate formate lyase activating enzyme